ncbi:MAG: hypothetical protein AAGF56_04250 [Pseudomonadota bacterium]
MFLELIATFAAGFGAAGLALAVNIITGGKLPKWVMPVAAGLAMIGVGIANEYSWGGRTADNLPEDVVVIEDVTQSNWYRPWSYVWPQTVRLMALDRATVQTRDDQPDVKLIDLYLFARWQPPAKVQQLVHCSDQRLAMATPGALADPKQALWSDANPRVLAEICGST